MIGVIMKKVLKILLISILVIATACIVACKTNDPYKPPKNEFGDGNNGGFGGGVGESPDSDGGSIIKSFIIVE